MHSLPLFVRLHGQPVILLGSGDAAAAKRRLLERAGAIIVGEDDGAARIAFIALDDDDAARLAAERLKARGLLVNAADRPALCDFTTPAIIDRDAVLIAISTGGASAGLAKALRQRMETILPASIGELADALFAARDKIKSKWAAADQRRRAIDAALAPGGMLDPLLRQSEGAVDRWLAAPDTSYAAGRYTVKLRSDDPDDLSINEMRLLGSADRVHYGAGVPAAVLNRVRADAVLLPHDGEAGVPEPEADEVVIILTGAQPM